MEKLNTFFRRLKINASVSVYPSFVMVVNCWEILCSPYSNEKSKNTGLILMPIPIIRLKLMGWMDSSIFVKGNLSNVCWLSSVKMNLALGPM